jgi:serine/threonine protein phosphatase 1
VAERTLAIGDIHGCDVAFETLLSRLAPASGDTVVVLGDLVDRGPGSRQVIERMLALSRQCQLVMILGNHEEMMLDALSRGEWAEDWLRYGGLATVASYGGNPRNIPAEHLNFLETGVSFLETAREIFVHANLQPDVPLEEQVADWLRWTHLSGHERPHPSGKRIICGHTPQRSGTPLVVPGWACIDTFACGGGWLTGLDVGTNDFVQTNQAGEIRTGRLTGTDR